MLLNENMTLQGKKVGGHGSSLIGGEGTTGGFGIGNVIKFGVKVRIYSITSLRLNLSNMETP